MKKLISLLLIAGFSFSIYSQSYLKSKLSYVMTTEGYGTPVYAYSVTPPNPLFLPYFPIPPGAIPYMVSYSDYTTNGNTLIQIYVNGDTVVVAMTYVDSIDAKAPNNSNSLRMIYNYSFNGGTTWLDADLTPMSPEKSRYPDMTLVGSGSIRVPLMSGRFWRSSTIRAAGVAKDLLFGVGNGITYFVPGTGQAGNTDLFSAKMSNGNIACIFQRSDANLANDTIYFLTFNPVTNTFSSMIPIHRTTLTNTTADYKIAAGTGGNLIVAYDYINEPQYGGDPLRSVRYQTSSDYGATWNPPFGQNPPKILGNGIINGDSIQPYWHEDIVYKPGTANPYIVVSTFDYTAATNPLVTRTSWKIIIWNPVLNGGNPVVVADYNNIPVLQDTNTFNLVTRIRTIKGVNRLAFQVNSAVLSHPSIGFSSDGNTIYCAFSVTQIDTSWEGFNFYDVWATKSTNGGLNWSTPQNITNTPLQDEMYPCVARTGNDAGAKIVFQSTRFPGCCCFGPSNSIESDSVSAVYECYLSGVIGINNISGKVPVAYSLKQNYPNPFNPSTKIGFEVKNSSYITLKVYNIIGQLVTTIINNQKVEPGTKEVDFTSSTLASGIYFYTLTATNGANEVFRDTKKMILLK